MTPEAEDPVESALRLPAGSQMIRRAPSKPLAGVVSRLTGYLETVSCHFRVHEVASLHVPLVISFGAPFRIGLGRPPGTDDDYSSFTAGLFSGHVVIESFGASHCLQVDFTPLGAYRFFGLPMTELSGQMIALHDLPGLRLEDLREWLGAEDDWENRFDLVEAFICSRIAAAPVPSTDIAWAYRSIVAGSGSLRIGTIVENLGCSRKHLAARFRTEVGLGPKEVARIARFNRALALASDAKDNGSWAGIAAACGYADQAHLVREFRALAGETPTTWRTRLS